MVLKPSEVSPLNAVLFAEILDAAGVPPGVFNLAERRRPDRRRCAMQSSGRRHGVVHPDRRGRASKSRGRPRRPSSACIRNSAEIRQHSSRRRRSWEGRGPSGVNSCFSNSGQSCTHDSVLVPAARRGMTKRSRCTGARRPRHRIGPADDGRALMALSAVRDVHMRAVQRPIEMGIEEGALLRGGRGQTRPDGLTRGYYVRPTVLQTSRRRRRSRAKKSLARYSRSCRIATKKTRSPLPTTLPFPTSPRMFSPGDQGARGALRALACGQRVS